MRLAQLGVLGDLGRLLRQVGALWLETTLVGQIVDAVLLLVGRDELEAALLADGAGFGFIARVAATHLLHLSVKPGGRRSGQVRSREGRLR